MIAEYGKDESPVLPTVFDQSSPASLIQSVFVDPIMWPD